MTLHEMIKLHTSLYPGMEMDDCLKLVYQSALGGGHMIEDEAAFADRLREELALPGLFTASPPAPTPVGGGQCRVHLSALENGPGVPTLTALCARAARHAGDAETLRARLEELRVLALEGALLWPDAAGHIDAYIEAGCPLQHHSERFAELYAPHYRLMERTPAAFLPVFAAIDRAMAQKPHVLVGIDGMCTAGKSGLAALLEEVYGCGLVMADDFFLRPYQRIPSRLAKPGGNIDYERMAPIARWAGEGQPFRYQVYDCQSGGDALGAWRQVPGGPLTVLEGAYCMHPRVNARCDVRVFLSVDAAEQERRILARNGPEMAERFKNEWIPMENAYFSAFNVREGCDVVIDTTGLWG